MKRRLFIGSGAVVAAAGGAYWFNLTNAGPDASTTGSGFGAAVAETTEDTKIDTSSVVEMTMGDKNAPITVVEYFSFTCPHCADFHNDVLPDLKKNYIETGKVHYIAREAFFSKYDLWASLMARCGGEMRYFGIAKILMETQREWLGDGNPDTVIANLRKIGLTSGLTNEDLDACFQDEAKVEMLVAWYQENFARDDMNSTPSFLINGKKHNNMNFAKFSEVLDAKLAE